MAKEPREFFESKCEAMIRELKAELDDLDYRMENVSWDPGVEGYREIAALKSGLDEAENKLQALRATSGADWVALREELEGELAALAETIRRDQPGDTD